MGTPGTRTTTGYIPVDHWDSRCWPPLIDAPFDCRDWVFESKWDGFRLVARIEKGGIPLYSRSGGVVSDKYEPIAKALEKVKQDAVIDGELVALDAHGVSRFQLLQNALSTRSTCTIASSTSCSWEKRSCAVCHW
jgi:ATP-dependent DNA ligase